MEIEIPSPSVFLKQSPILTAAVPTPLKKSTKRRGSAPTRPPPKSNPTTLTTGAEKGGIVKPKQSKSRNGCMTCKKKRLKCDETKPTCVQCEKRNVECEGYKKEYKWRQFEEINKHPRAGKVKRTLSSNLDSRQEVQDGPKPAPKANAEPPKHESEWSPGLQHAFTSAAQALTGPSPPSDSSQTKGHARQFSPSQFDPLPILNPGFSPSDLDLPSPLAPPIEHQTHEPRELSSNHSFSTGSPTLVDLLLPSTDPNQPPDPSEMRPPMVPLPYQPGCVESSLQHDTVAREGEDFDEEIIRDPMTCQFMDFSEQQWRMRSSSPANSDVSSASSQSTDLSILRPPRQDPSSPEMLMLRFDRDTCGILSIKDGLDNPWRTLVWPMAEDSLALRHAVFSMTALHGATSDPRVRLAGIAHMNKSISKLSADIGSMTLDQALATALALALGEGWDDRISTGVQHLKGAKILVNKALAEHAGTIHALPRNQLEAKRLKFLCNTYVYLDVIARLTSIQDQDPLDLENVLIAVNGPPGNMEAEIDPLMGCATTLFPLIGKVASLVQQILQSPSNSLNVVSEANELREQLLHWQPPDVRLVDDTRVHVEQAIQTAEAYRRAILLHLHQAVPELPSESNYDQAKEILTILAATPLSSPTLIVQIFPLLVGSCEMVSSDDRQWVTRRWDAMMRRLAIVNVASCWDLVQEVWKRRDHHMQLQARRAAARNGSRNAAFAPPALKRKMMSVNAISDDAFFDAFGQDGVLMHDSNGRPGKRRLTFDGSLGRAGMAGMYPASESRRVPGMPISNLGPEYTVRGHLHWLSVMAEWNWEVFLG